MPIVKKILFFLIIWLVLGPSFAFAHGARYLEFNPDTSSSLKVSDVETPSQAFYPQSDFLGGVDVWLANPGSGGTVTFNLLNNEGSILTAKTVNIGNIAETVEGARLHVDFNSQIAVLGSQKYSVKITSSMPELRLYYSNRIQVLAHNAPFASEYITGVGKLGEEEQDFSFKYALYETTESSAPIISNVNWTVVSADQMSVDFNANEPVDYKIEYGPVGQGYIQSTNFAGDYSFCVSGIATCSLVINVSSGVNYQYILTARDSWGNQSQSSGTFTSGYFPTPSPTPSADSTSSPQASPGQTTPTSSPASSPTPAPTGATQPTSQPPPLPDNEPPVISNLRIAAITDKSVEVAWTTDEAANSHLLISTPFFITITDVNDPTFELEHLLKTADRLGPKIKYVATATSIDAASNTSRASISFTTLPVFIPQSTPQENQPNQSNQPNQQSQGPNISFNSSSGGGVIQWDLPVEGEPSGGYRVDIIDKNGNLVRTILVPKGSYSADVADLKDGEYSVVVYANNDSVFKKIDQPINLKVEPPFIKRLLGFWWALILPLAGLGYILWRNSKRKINSDYSN